MTQEIRGKIKRIMIVRALLLAGMALLAVLFSTLILEQFLIKNALRQEASYFWENHQKNPQLSPPDTWNLKSFLLLNGSSGTAPDDLMNQPLGFTHLKDHPGYTLLYKTEQGDKQLLLLFDGDNVRSLAFFLGVIPMAIFLLLSYVLGWLFYRKAEQVLSPISWLADKFDRFDPMSPQLPTINLDEIPEDADREATVLAKSLSDYSERIKRFIARERAFTRDVSHELRTPLTVIGMAVDMIKTDGQLNKSDQRSLQRITSSTKDMKELIDVFLILARESDHPMEEGSIWVAEVVAREVEKCKMLLGEKPIALNIIKNQDLQLNTSEKILEVMLGNLIRNACAYTDEGQIDITINENHIIVHDTGVGMSEQQVEQIFRPFYRAGASSGSGHGIGLTIVKRISARYNWQVDVDSELGVGSKVVVYFDGHA